MENKIIEHEYHGERITFCESREEWKVVFDGKEQYHKSLQIVKNYIDCRNKKKFDRIPVFVQKGYSYFGRKEGYQKAVITSVGVDGTIFIVEEGSKHAEHCGTAYVRNAKNRKLIEEIAALQKVRNQTDDKLDAAKKSLVTVDFDALTKKALGEEK